MDGLHTSVFLITSLICISISLMKISIFACYKKMSWLISNVPLFFKVDGRLICIASLNFRLGNSFAYQWAYIMTFDNIRQQENWLSILHFLLLIDSGVTRWTSVLLDFLLLLHYRLILDRTYTNELLNLSMRPFHLLNAFQFNFWHVISDFWRVGSLRVCLAANSTHPLVFHWVHARHFKTFYSPECIFCPDILQALPQVCLAIVENPRHLWLMIRC